MALAIGGVGPLVANTPRLQLVRAVAGQRRRGTEGLVMGLSGPASTNVVALPIAEPGFEGQQRRIS